MNFITGGAIKRTTPQIVKDIRDTVIYAVSGLLVFAPLLVPRLGIDGTEFAMWIGLIVFAVKVIAKFFGVSEEEAVANAVKANDQVATIIETKKTDI